MTQDTKGYFAFPTFEGACLWYALWGRKAPTIDNQQSTPNNGDSDADMADTNAEDEDESNDAAAEGGTDIEDEGNDNLDLEGAETNLDNSEDESFELASDFETDYEIDDPLDDTPQIPGFRRETTDQGDEFIHEFPSWYDFAIRCRDGERVWPAKDQGSQEKGNEDWTGNVDFSTTIRMALETGWPDGLRMLHDLETLVVPQPIVTEAWDFNVAGAFPSIPTYCAGDPACMVTDLTAKHCATRPIVRIDFGKDCSAFVSPETIIQRGAAGLSLANTLEKQGYSTELRIVGASREGNKTLCYSIVFKRAGDPLDLEIAAFAIAHPAVLRRMTFVLYEQHKELYANFNCGYGLPLYQPNDPTSGQRGGAIFIPAPMGSETSDQSRKFVEECALASGFGEIFPTSLKNAA